MMEQRIRHYAGGVVRKVVYRHSLALLSNRKLLDRSVASGIESIRSSVSCS